MLSEAIRRSRAGTVLVSLLLASGCGPAIPPSGHPRPLADDIIPAEEIERLGAQNALELLRWIHSPIRIRESPISEPVLSMRGQRTAPLVVIDGAPTFGTALLYTFATDIASIRVLDTLAAYQRYGPSAAGGAILIETKQGRRR